MAPISAELLEVHEHIILVLSWLLGRLGLGWVACLLMIACLRACRVVEWLSCLVVELVASVLSCSPSWSIGCVVAWWATSFSHDSCQVQAALLQRGASVPNTQISINVRLNKRICCSRSVLPPDKIAAVDKLRHDQWWHRALMKYIFKKALRSFSSCSLSPH